MEFRVEELAASAELSVDTIRYYQKIGLLDPPERRGRIGWYSEQHRSRLDDIAALSGRGFSLAQIAQLSSHPDDRLLDALRGTDVATVTRSELIERSGVSSDLVDLAIDAGLIRATTTEPETFGDDAIDMLAAASTILSVGLPIDALITIAVDHATHVETVVDAAIDTFGRHLPEGADPAGTIAALVPAVSELVAQHFRHTLIDRAATRLSREEVAR